MSTPERVSIFVCKGEGDFERVLYDPVTNDPPIMSEGGRQYILKRLAHTEKMKRIHQATLRIIEEEDNK